MVYQEFFTRTLIAEYNKISSLNYRLSYMNEITYTSGVGKLLTKVKKVKESMDWNSIILPELQLIN